MTCIAGLPDAPDGFTAAAIELDTVAGVFVIDAWVHGDFAVHDYKTVEDIAPTVVITHLPTGLRLAWFDEEMGEGAFAAVLEIQPLRADWAIRDARPSTIGAEVRAQLIDIVTRHGGTVPGLTPSARINAAPVGRNGARLGGSA